VCIPRGEVEVMSKNKKYFEDSRDHLREELTLIELLIKRQVLIMNLQKRTHNKFDEFSGMYISEDEIKHYLDQSAKQDNLQCVYQHEEVKALTDKIARQRRHVDGLIASSLRRGVKLRIPELSNIFELSETEIEILLCCVAPDVAVRFERYFAYLQNNISKKRPTVQLLSKIFFGEDRAVFEARNFFGSNSKLLNNGLLGFNHEIVGEEVPFPGKQPRVADSIIGFLLEKDDLDPSLKELGELVGPRMMAMNSSYYSYHQAILEKFIHYYEVHNKILLSYIWGPRGTGKNELVESIAHTLSKKVLRVDCSKMQGFEGSTRKLLGVMERERRLHCCIIQFSHFDELLDAHNRENSKIKILRDLLEKSIGGGVIVTGEKSYAEIKGILGLTLIPFHIPLPSIEQRYEIWNKFLKCLSSEDEQELINGLAVKFRFAPDQIMSVLNSAAIISSTKNGNEQLLELSDLYKCCREESNQGLLLYCQKILPNYTWEDIVLPKDILNQLEEICNCVKSRRKVYCEWGFESKFSLGKGLNILFSGPSGTGKTMSAEIIARELGLDLYKIDLSCVVSKYIGETEKNLSKIFREAETSNCILFFDEADALFGKRTEVKDSHDRYANIEINFLLQRMDEYEGVVILATNMRKNLDPAFTRRLNYVVEFPFPGEKYRDLIWRKVFPVETPISDDINFGFLSRKFKIAGGNIKNVAMNSAFLAAKDGGQVNMQNVMMAIKREFQKMGKLCSKSDFGQYYSLVRDDQEL
jgi:SpoVK/Ycf46/Vps4 family AAA+-type ATPase